MKKNFTLIAVFLFALFLTIPVRLSAQVNCTAPADLAATYISSNGVVLSMGTATNTGVYNIRYHGPNSTTWITQNNVSVPFQLGNLTCHTAYEWQAQQVCGTTPNGAVVLSDWSVGATFTTGNCPTTTCPVPTYLSTTNITQNGAVLNLETLSNSGTFNIRYRVPNAPNYVVINNVTMPYQLGNLTCHTAYEWQAQKVCANSAGTTGALSEWSAAVTFSTANCPEPTPCPVPTNLTASNISQTGAVLHFGSTATTGRYNIRYHGPNSTNWITVNNVTMPFQLGELTCHTTYEWQAQQICTITGATNYNLSAWSVGAAFTTSACSTSDCPVPANLTATNISQTGALLNVSTTTNAGVYNIRYHGPNSTTWITVNNVTMPFQLGDLTCHTTYEWQAQQVCHTASGAAPVLSNWSTGAAFTTANCPTPTCPVPTYLSTTNITQTGAVLNLGSIANTGTFNIRYRVPNSPNWIVINTVTMPYQLRELTCHTAYEWQAQKVCTNADNSTAVLSDWSAAAAFTTAGCPTPICPVPANLLATNITQTGAVLNTGTTTATGMYNIRYHGPNSTNWIMVNNVTMPYQLRELTCHTVYEWQAQRVCANTGTTTGALSEWSAGAAFTTANCPTTTCPVPAYLATTNITQNGAVLNAGTATNAGMYNIRYHGANSTNWIVINNVTMPYQLRELTCHTTYEWQAQKVCGNADNTTTAVSDWSAGVTFTTANCTSDACPAPNNLTATNITQTGAVLHFGATVAAGRYNIRFQSADSASWIIINNVTMPFQLSNLRCHATYEWQAQQICTTTPGAAPVLSAWSSGATFTTAACHTDVCPVPTNLMATHIGETGAVLQWTGVTGVVGYVVQYKPVNSTLPFTSVRTTTNFVQIGGLTVGTEYVWQVAAVCQNGTIASWSPRAEFSTRSQLVAYPNPANQSTSVTFWSDRRATVDVKVLDLYGKEVIIQQREAVEGNNVFGINTSGVADGLYMIGVYSDGNLTTTKVVIKH